MFPFTLRPGRASFEGGDSKVTALISAAASVENSCRMDPAWNPWV